MVTRKRIFDLYEKLHSYAETGRRLGFSRQYVHMVVTGYANTGKHNTQRSSEVKKVYSTNNRLCRVCKKNRWRFGHHKDFNNLNDVPRNIILVCKSCHVKLHQKHRFDALKNIKCEICKNSIVRKRGNTYTYGFSRKLCKICYEYTKRHKDKSIKNCLRKHEYLDNCTTCHRKFGINFKRKYKNMCTFCYYRTPEFRKLNRERHSIYFKKRYRADKVFREKIKLINKINYEKQKDKKKI